MQTKKLKLLSLLSLFLMMSVLPFAVAEDNCFVFEGAEGEFDECTNWGMTASGVQSGQYMLMWNSSNPSGFALADHTGINVHVNLSKVQCTNPPLDWTNWFTGMWDCARKDLNVNLTLWVPFVNRAVSTNFLVDSHSSLWGASASTDLHYATFVNASVPLRFPNEIDLGFFRSGNTITAYMQYIDKGIKFENGSYAPIRLTNDYVLASDDFLLTGGCIPVLEISHAGSGDVDISFVGSEITKIPTGWDFTESVEEGAQWYTGIVESIGSFGALFSVLIGIAGKLISIAPFLLLMFVFSMILSCMFTLSIDPLRNFVEFVWNTLQGAIGAITGIIGAIKDFIQWW